jgi:hypothetical protein
VKERRAPAAFNRGRCERSGLWCREEEVLDAGVPVAAEIVLVGVDLGIHLHFYEFRSFPSHLWLLV